MQGIALQGVRLSEFCRGLVVMPALSQSLVLGSRRRSSSEIVTRSKQKFWFHTNIFALLALTSVYDASLRATGIVW